LTAAKPELVKAEVSAGLDLVALRARRAGDRVRTPTWWPIGRELSTDRTLLVDILRGCAETTIGPRWDAIRDHLAQEVARRAQQLATEGLGRVLATLHPGLRWRSPVLELDWGPADRISELHLQGRGLELVPSVLYRELTPPYLPLGDEAAPRVLFYPAPIEADQALRMLRSPEEPGQALSDLLGRSRALVLRCLADGCGTTELARRTGLSLAGASQHAAVLRAARLVVTTREGGAVRHNLTALGYQLLDQA